MVQAPSLIPPQILNKIQRLQAAERREYVQELIGRYEVKQTRVKRASRRIARSWAEGQTEHFEAVLRELREYR